MGTSDNDGRVDYIELVVHRIDRARDFYRKAFGWNFKEYGPSYCEFSDGRLTGGFVEGVPNSIGGPLVVFFAVDLAATYRRLEEAGATIVKPIFSFPGGQRFHFRD